MISPAEACQYVQQQLPEISCEVPPEGDIYGTLNAVREYACQKTREHNFNRLQQCFTVAESLYAQGSGAVKCAVENVFVYALSRIFTIAPEDKKQIKAILPASLRSLYMNQVLHHGY